MALDKIPERGSSKYHDTRGNDHSRDHDLNSIHHANCSDYRIKRKDNIQQHDLNDHIPKRRPYLCSGATLLTFQLLVDLMHTFPEQEEPTCKQHQVTTRDFKSSYRKEG